jgi:hypothetical protein
LSGGEQETAGDAGREMAGGGRQHLAYDEARLAYNIIQALLTHTQVTQDLIALMARVLDRDAQDALVNTPNWSAYMDSRRVLEGTRSDIEKFVEVWTSLAEEVEPPPAPEAAPPSDTAPPSDSVPGS